MTRRSITTGTAGRTPTEGNFVLNAVLGAVVSVVVSFVPFSPALGGAVAGYLQGEDGSRGAKVGAAAGVLATFPILAVVGLLSLFLLAGPGPRGAVMVLFVAVMAILFAAVYVVGLSALGGWAAARFGERRRADAERRRGSADGDGTGPAVEHPPEPDA